MEDMKLPRVIAKKTAQRALKRVGEEIALSLHDSLQVTPLRDFVLEAFDREITNIQGVAEVAADKLTLFPQGQDKRIMETHAA